MSYDTQEGHTTWLYDNYIQFKTDNYELFTGYLKKKVLSFSRNKAAIIFTKLPDMPRIRTQRT